MTPRLRAQLDAFASENKVRGKGWLAVMLVIVNHARAENRGLPLDADALVTEGGGQVLGLGKGAVQNILKRHGIDRVLAEEGGRTSRGAMGNMRKVVTLLNALHAENVADIEAIETWVVHGVRQFFAAKPFSLKLDPSKSVRAAVRDLLAQAERRQQENSGTMYVGAVLQHLLGAKLEIVLGIEIEHHGASVADAVSNRDADFQIGDVAIHCSTAPGEALLRKCQRNLDAGLKPIIVTVHHRTPVALGLAEQLGIGDRVEIFDAEQFVASNLHELGRFESAGRRESAARLIDRYNAIVERCETDPSLKVEIQ